MDKPFDPNGWRYGDREDVLRQVEERFSKDPVLCTELEEALIIGGGKAFGLRLCALVARSDQRLCVPPWRFVDAVSQMDLAREDLPIAEVLGELARDRDVIVRSSEPDEDWGNPASGTAQSTVSASTPLALAMAFGRASRDASSVVVQRIAPGIGVVVDVVWSELLRRPIVRTKTGRMMRDTEGRIHYTSGTWDVEGLSRIWDPDSGEPLLPTHAGTQLTGDADRIPTGEIAYALARGLRACDIAFGVQFEVVVHPDEPDVWNLVQMRPSPGAVRSAMPAAPDTTILAVSPGTSHACDVRAPMIPVTPRDALDAMHFASGVEKPELVERMTGRILLWENIPTSEDYWIAAVSALSSAGVIGHITRGVMLINTTHGMILRGQRSRNRSWDDINRRAAVVGVDTQAFETLHKLAKHTRTTVRIVSDGVVAHVSIPPPVSRR